MESMESIYTSQPYIYAFIVQNNICVKMFDITRLGYTYTHVVYIPRAIYIYIYILTYLMQELLYFSIHLKKR